MGKPIKKDTRIQKGSRRYWFSSWSDETWYKICFFTRLFGIMWQVILKNKAIEALDYMRKYESKDFENVVKELK